MANERRIAELTTRVTTQTATQLVESTDEKRSSEEVERLRQEAEGSLESIGETTPLSVADSGANVRERARRSGKQRSGVGWHRWLMFALCLLCCVTDCCARDRLRCSDQVCGQGLDTSCEYAGLLSADDGGAIGRTSQSASAVQEFARASLRMHRRRRSKQWKLKLKRT